MNASSSSFMYSCAVVKFYGGCLQPPYVFIVEGELGRRCLVLAAHHQCTLPQTPLHFACFSLSTPPAIWRRLPSSV